MNVLKILAIFVGEGLSLGEYLFFIYSSVMGEHLDNPLEVEGKTLGA